MDADIERNQILIRANPIELEEVRTLLVKLGEIPEGENRATTRIFTIPPGKDYEEVLARNPAVVAGPGAESAGAAAVEAGGEARRSEARFRAWGESEGPGIGDFAEGDGVCGGSGAVGECLARAGGTGRGTGRGTGQSIGRGIGPSFPGRIFPGVCRRALRGGEGRSRSALGAASVGSPTKPEQAAAGGPAPITIQYGPEGQLIISSSDTRALDRMEDLLSEASSIGRDDYRVFKLTRADAYSVASVLRELFEGKKDAKRRYPYWAELEYGPLDQEKETNRLSKRRALKIITDLDRNMIIVQHADADQLREIEKLIKLYDRPEEVDAQSIRKTEIFRLEHAKAEIIAETIKEVYRDLLSSIDKALQGAGQQQRPRGDFSSFYYYETGGEGGEEQGQKAARFKGALSIGVDKNANCLIVSAQKHLLDDIRTMIEELDKAAEPVEESVSVVRLSPGIGPSKLKESLLQLMGTGQRGPSQPQQGGPDRQGRGRRGRGGMPGGQGNGSGQGQGP